MKKRLFGAIMAFCMLASLIAPGAFAAARPRLYADTDGGYAMGVIKAQKLPPGAAFDPDTAEVADKVSPGDVVVLTVGFRNNASDAVNIAGFTLKLPYDAASFAPYTGAEPFAENPYQMSDELISDYHWLRAGNAGSDGVMLLNAIGMSAYSVAPGTELVFARFALLVKDDASAGNAVFRLASNAEETNVLEESSGELTFSPLSVELSVTREDSNAVKGVAAKGNAVTVSLAAAPKDAASVIVVAFSEQGKALRCAVADNIQGDTASLTIGLSGAAYLKAFLLDTQTLRPLSEGYKYAIPGA